jgi:hypothetical protein
VRNVKRMENMRNECKSLVGKQENKRSRGRPRRSWEDNIKMDLNEIWCEGVDWMRLDQNRNQWRALVNTEMNLRVP